MERSHSLACKQQVEEGDFNLKEWGVRARRISRENTKSRRFSASNFREEARSFRSNTTAISSTASSPGYTAVREEIDPSTYSFTTAIKVYSWEFQSAEGMSLNSKWNEAEKYICNPLSGEVPLECLSAKTLSRSGRSFRSSCRITMSAPLIYPSNINSHMHHFHANPPPINQHQPQITSSSIINIEKKTRDVGTQSTAVDLRSSSPSPAPTPSIEDRSIKIISPGDSSLSTPNFKSHTQVEVEERIDVERGSRKRSGGERKKQQMMSRCSSSNSQGGCLSLRGLWMRTVRHRDKHKPRTTNNTNIHSTFLHHLNV